MDPLHGRRDGTGPTTCVDLGGNTPLGSNSTMFGFTISPGPQTGDLFLDILLPNNYSSPPLSFSITENPSTSLTANQFSPTAWTSGFLDTYLGISASPSNPIGAYLPNTQVLDSGATGFYVYQVNVGTLTISANPGAANGPNFGLPIPALPSGAYIVAFCGTGCTKPDVATANSGALLVNYETVPPEQIYVPEPGALGLVSIALLGLGLTAARRRVS